MTEEEKAAIELFCNRKAFLIFCKAKINEKLFTSKLYKKIKTNDFKVKIIINDGSQCYASIKCYFQYNNDLFVAFYNYNIVEDRRIIIEKFSLLVSNILPVEKSNVLNIVKIADISSITNVILNNNYICVPPHLLNVFM